jgi:hypothetical protein
LCIKTQLSQAVMIALGGVFHSFIHFPLGSQLEHRATFGVSVITYTIRHKVGFLCTSDQPVAEACTYTGQHNV